MDDEKTYSDLAAPHAGHSMSMDVVHAQMLARFIERVECLDVVEVGCCHGVSTGAILDALTSMGSVAEDRVGYMHLIDPVIQPSVREMIKRAKAATGDRELLVEVSEAASMAAFSVMWDGSRPVILKGLDGDCLLILDGDHSVENVSAEIQAVFGAGIRPRAIALHDVGRGGLDGPRAALRRLTEEYGYAACVDDEPREGLRTERGLAIACRDLADYGAAQEVMR